MAGTPSCVTGDFRMATVRSIEGCLLGIALGDALGLPYENVPALRVLKLLGEPDRFRFVFGRGMVSDDTEHACMTAQSLIAAGNDISTFERSLAGHLRRWIVLLPAATGLATARACFKLLVGFSPRRSGVFSAGNGPAMRSPVLGAAIDDLALLKVFVQSSTRITHTDPKAEYGALAVALAARESSLAETVDPEQFVQKLKNVLGDAPAAEFLELVDRAVQSAGRTETGAQFAASLGLSRGVTGYIYHTVPVVLQVWFRHPRDFRGAMRDVILCGGDTDTTAAILGGIIGAGVGKQGLPEEWLRGLWEWPLTVGWMEQLAAQLGAAHVASVPARPPHLPIAGVVPRNLLFLAVVLFHGLRRLLPPYA